MRYLNFDIKPVRIRFAFGENECATLEQLQLNFSPKAIYENYPQLLKWLEQNHNKDIKDQLVEKQGEICQNRDAESLFLLYSIFFQKMFEERKIYALSDLCFNWYNNSERNTKSYRYLCKEINTRKWGLTFFLDLSSRLITTDKQTTSPEEIFTSYKTFCSESDFFKTNGIKNLQELYISLSSDKDCLLAFDFLDKEIRKHEWKYDFFFDIIPHLYSISVNDKELPIIKRGKLNHSLESNEGLYSLYNFFLHDLCDEKGIHDLGNLYRFLLFNSDSTNFINLHKEITKNEWHISFFSTLIKELIAFHHNNRNNNHYDIKKIGLSDDSQEDLYSLYHYFLEGYLKFNCIENIKNLYLYWNNNGYYRHCFTNLHEEIINTKWGCEFLNDIVKTLLTEYNKSINPNEEKRIHLLDEKNTFAFYKKYFGYYVASHNINNISGLYLYWSKDGEYKKCFESLESILYNNMWGVKEILELYKNNTNYFDKEHWLNILHNLEEFLRGCPENHDKFNNQCNLAKIYIEDFKKLNDGYKILLTVAKAGYSKACTDLKLRRSYESKINKSFVEKYIQCDKCEWNKNRDGDYNYTPNTKLQAIATTLREKWIMKTNVIIHKLLVLDMSWEKREYIVDRMREMREDEKFIDLRYGYGIEEKLDDFYGAFTDRGPNRDSYKRLIMASKYRGANFLEIRFIYALIGLNDNNTYKSAMELLNSLKDDYPLVNFFLENKNLPKISAQEGSCYGKLLAGDEDDNILNDALRTYCKNMVYYF